MKINQFTIGTIAFGAIHTKKLRPHWLLHLLETGEVFGPGVGGISNESVPKMQASVQELLDRVSKGDVTDFRKRFGLPETAATQHPRVMVFDYGYAGTASELGFQHVSVVQATKDEILTKHAHDDLIFVMGAAVPGAPKTYEFGRFERVNSIKHDGL